MELGTDQRHAVLLSCDSRLCRHLHPPTIHSDSFTTTNMQTCPSPLALLSQAYLDTLGRRFLDKHIRACAIRSRSWHAWCSTDESSGRVQKSSNTNYGLQLILSNNNPAGFLLEEVSICDSWTSVNTKDEGIDEIGHSLPKNATLCIWPRGQHNNPAIDTHAVEVVQVCQQRISSTPVL